MRDFSKELFFSKEKKRQKKRKKKEQKNTRKKEEEHKAFSDTERYKNGRDMGRGKDDFDDFDDFEDVVVFFSSSKSSSKSSPTVFVRTIKHHNADHEHFDCATFHEKKKRGFDDDDGWG